MSRFWDHAKIQGMARSVSMPPPAARRPGHIIFIDVENTSSEAATIPGMVSGR